LAHCEIHELDAVGDRLSVVAPKAILANRMKAGREHGVPLSGRTVSMLKQLAKLKAGNFVFPGHARGKPLSNMAMEMK
jgi:hypothetical protein